MIEEIYTERLLDAETGLKTLTANFGDSFPTRKIANRLYASAKQGNKVLIFRMQKHGKYHYQTLGILDKQISLEEAVEQSFVYEKQLNTNGYIDDYTYQLQEHRRNIKTIDDLAYDWFIASEAEFDITEPEPLKNMAQIQSLYHKHIQPYIGNSSISHFDGCLIEVMVKKIRAKAAGTPFSYKATAKMAREIAEKLLKRGIRYRLIDINVASYFTARETGYVDDSDRTALAPEELLYLIQCLEKVRNTDPINVNIVYILLVLGTRKGDLIKAHNEDFGHATKHLSDDEEADLVWNLTAEKNGIQRAVYLPQFVQTLLLEIVEVQNGSNYLFPARKSNSDSPFISSSTPNQFIRRIAPKLTKVPHELRHTCRTLLSELDVSDHVADSYILHSTRRYRHDDYHLYPARKRASIELSDTIENLIEEARLLNLIEEVMQENKNAKSISES